MRIQPRDRQSCVCPRCGYDQRGPIATWTESCPLQGTCSECGLVFNWAEVLMPEKFEPQWCVEFVPRRRSIPWVCVKTYFRSFWPWGFWSRLKMSQPIRSWRLAAYVIFLLWPLLFFYVCGESALAIYVRYQVAASYSTWTQQMAKQVSYMQMQLQVMQKAQKIQSMTQEERDAEFDGDVPFGLGTPTEYRHAVEFNARRPASQLASDIQAMLQSISIMQAQSAVAPVINQSYLAAIVEAVVFPLRQFSWGTIALADGTTVMYPAPTDNYSSLAQKFSGNTLGRNPDFGIRLVCTLLISFLLTVMLPICFILLPVSRRLAKVRWSHVWRVAVYSLFALQLTQVLSIVVMVLYVTSFNRLGWWLANYVPVAFCVTLPAWWAVAIKRYLKMPHAGAIAGLMTLMLAMLMSPLLAQVLPQWFVSLILD